MIRFNQNNRRYCDNEIPHEFLMIKLVANDEKNESLILVFGTWLRYAYLFELTLAGNSRVITEAIGISAS